ncbi:tyrosine--tRNA ligase, chloroplastic/mitochondrial-like [Phoenix dactylifera]|uniref:tyrosine--tRNA ligase n=1 Tax=Phoenix dactylifera TaxID=42345 RepID=A0A8B8J1W3_PHODC|nr:tyrosine--tRNA ligase, chloroplastic/mitochondrial-like [Phoenix dactylifera]XP_026658539.2 tyrosine--tRNA ligase, chloroplastic/mitochondrial-like [Phoenix dactylifera]XP_026658540.2 tyrosine--tRNA ligase, chloroplastic/mitochondrial-like [Phoenix dactylifera]
MAAAAAASRTFLLFHPKLLEASRIFSYFPRHRRNLPLLLRRSSSQSAAQPTLEAQARNLDSPSGIANVVDILQERGLVESITSESIRSACSNPIVSPLKVYCGFDPTAESLHLGNLLGLIVLSWFRRCGHKAVAVIGGATGCIGDPSGKSLERPELDVETLEKNSAGIKNIISKILRDENSVAGTGKEKALDVGSEKGSILETGVRENANLNPHSENNGNLNVRIEKNAALDSRLDDSFTILNNYDWWKDITLLDFLREVGRFARVGVMMAKESVKKRLMSEEGMSYTEFTYQLLQGYDFLYLFKNMGANVQIGGSDQWGNITAGTELIRKILQVEGAYGLTFPLLLKSDGTKFGKSEGGATWLSASMLSPYKFYQYFFSVPDIDVVRFLRILTFLSMEEIRELEDEMKKPSYAPNTAQRRLAEEVTRFVHGEDGLTEALKATETLRPGAETKLDWETIEGIAEDVPSCSLAYGQVLNSSLVDLSVSTGLLSSKSAARRLMKQGGLYLNNRRVDNEAKVIEAGDIVDEKILLLSAGKKNKMVIKIC